MSAVLADTDIVSMVFKGDPRVERYRRHLTGNILAVSFMTVAELQRWALRRNWGVLRRAEMEAHLQNYVVLLCERDLCLTWAEVMESARRNGRPIDCADAWIAATALRYRVPLVTNNARDFAGVDRLVVMGAEG